ncbi:MAG: YebC/PmpR family DNA-binding transcriptional regulator [Alphaproteobacteria bacterium]|nr:YebC/PmpR family DNA-binding transcriptional regulator [Alphaproteobacteria bacterium]
MAGHSKWHNIQHRKGAQDKARGNLFTKLAREITTAAKLGDMNPENNPRLRVAILNARKNSMPNDNIKRAVDKAGDKDTDNFVGARYEGKGPGNVPIIIEALTDNPRRTAPEIRHAFSKFGGEMGTENSVMFFFTQFGLIFYPLSAAADEDAMMMAIMDAGADDMETSEHGYIVKTKPDDFMSVQKNLSDSLGEPERAEITFVANNPMEIDDDTEAKLDKLINALDDLDDVQKVITGI